MHTATVHNFSFPGATAEDDLETQMATFFARFPPKSSTKSEPSLDPSRTSYFLHLGINDCGATDEDDLDEIVEKLMDAAHDLYVKAGARNFVFVDVIPMDRTPGAQSTDSEDTIRSRVETWNESLRTRVAEFAESTSQASVFLWSTHAALAEILDDPEEFGFAAGDVTDEGGNIWLDEIHATSSVHKIMAERFAKTFFPEP
ncbi:carbohydrate esterase family 16 protein [Polyporus arcularius HHB13444]|uniref:Carbohydrate esterase family 16 protein n=1 Tax=Polyporus arcularius HHB13444 TaxID=1314778 RepID=A0A5C3PB84_9APHY|nr:carbohydrate esterase family 16 protein [Polyporus arcularius HHB13444]